MVKEAFAKDDVCGKLAYAQHVQHRCNDGFRAWLAAESVDACQFELQLAVLLLQAIPS